MGVLTTWSGDPGLAGIGTGTGTGILSGVEGDNGRVIVGVLNMPGKGPRPCMPLKGLKLLIKLGNRNNSRDDKDGLSYDREVSRVFPVWQKKKETKLQMTWLFERQATYHQWWKRPWGPKVWQHKISWYKQGSRRETVLSNKTSWKVLEE